MVSETNLGAAHFMKRLGKAESGRNLDGSLDEEYDDDDTAPTGDILSALAWVAEYESLVNQASQSNQISSKCFLYIYIYIYVCVQLCACV